MDAICALLATSTHGPDYFHAAFARDPTFDPEQVRIAWTGGRIVGCAKVYPRALRIGAQDVGIGAVDNVRVDPRFWHKGVATSLLSECLSALYLRGMVLAPLVSRRHDLFERRGWQPVAEQHMIVPVAALAELDAGASDITVRPFEGRDVDALVALHEAANAARTGTVVRGRDDWLARLALFGLQGASPRVAVCDGAIVGLAWTRVQGSACELIELLLAPWRDDAWRPLLHDAARHAGDAATLGATLPADYRRLIAAELGPAAALVRHDDLMLRIVDATRLLHVLTPTLEARLRDAGRLPPVAVRIGPLRGGVSLQTDADGRIAICLPRRDGDNVLPERLFLALLLGTEDAHEQLDRIALPDAVRAVLRRLFPAQDWVYWRSDAF